MKYTTPVSPLRHPGKSRLDFEKTAPHGGVHTIVDLSHVSPTAVFRMVRQAGINASLNMRYAMHEVPTCQKKASDVG